MSRYFFHVQDGVCLPDRKGVLLPNWADAQREAIRRAGEIISNSSTTLALGEDWKMTVTDEAGAALFNIDFHIAAAPALEGRTAEP